MPYIGHSPEVAQRRYESIDDISGSFNGSTTSFALQVGGVTPAPFPVASENVLISVGGVIQEPDGGGTNGFQLTGTNIVFSSAPAAGQSFFGVILAGADYVTAGHAFPDGDAGNPSITFSQDLDSGLFRSGAGTTSVSANNNKIADFGPSEIVFNEDGDNVDFRVEGDTKANLFVVDAGNDKITLDGDLEPTTINGITFPTAGTLSNRNLIINGAMQVAQRGTSFPSQTAGAYYLDRFRIHTFTLGTGVYQVDQSTDAPDGFQNSFKLSCTTADASTNANAQMSVYQALEGLDTNFLKYFQANPDTVTISFYVKSNRTGTFSAALKLSDNGSGWGTGDTKVYNFTYSISTANTWERKTVSITLDSSTSDTKTVNNSFAVSIQWWQLAGTSRDGATANSWVGNTNAATASTNLDLLESTSNNWFITGVQLELGEKATPFEHRSFGDELHRCQRYFTHSFQGAPGTGNTSNDGIVSVGGGTTGNTTSFLGTGRIEFSPNMRADPTITIFDLASPRNTGKCMRHTYGVAGTNNSAVGAHDINTKSFVVRSDGSASASGIIFHYQAEAEL